MKHFLNGILILFPAFLMAQEDICVKKPLCNHYQSFNMDKTTTSTGEMYDVVYGKIHWYVDPSIKYIKGQITTYFLPTQSTNNLTFDLRDNMSVDTVSYHGNLITDITHASNVVTINLPTNLVINNLDSIKIVYSGVPDGGGGFGSFEQTTQTDTILPIIWTLSEPYGAKDWWICKQTLSDKIDSMDIYITSPLGNKNVSNGTLKEITTQGTTTTYHWKHTYPITTYLVAIAVSDYYDYQDVANLPSGGTVPIHNFVFQKSKADAIANTGFTNQFIYTYSTLFGDYPFAKEKYGQAQFAWGGGMEHQTISFMANFQWDLQAHELAHQWFGDKVTCGSWKDIWLNEGFATYLTGLAKQNLTTGTEWYDWKRYNAELVKVYPDGSVYVDDTTSVWRIFDGRLTYSKGAMVLHTIRTEIGDSSFFKGIRNYLHEKNMGYAHTRDLQRHLEATSNQSLDYLFTNWVYGQGYPVYDIQWVYSAIDKQVNMVVKQTGSVANDFYKLHIPITLKNKQGNTYTVKLWNDKPDQVYHIPVAFIPNEIVFNEEINFVASANIYDWNTAYSNDFYWNNVEKSIYLDNPFAECEAVNLWTIDGKILTTLTKPSIEGTKIPTNLFHYATGIYVLEVVYKNGTKVLKKIVL